jgi:hypothetical protein
MLARKPALIIIWNFPKVYIPILTVRHHISDITFALAVWIII